MEGKWTSDLATLLRSHSPLNAIITCRGNDNSFGVYQHAMATHFSQNPLVWKRNGKVFPNRLTFPLKYVIFDDNLCWGPQLIASELPHIGFLHIFFINAASVDEYRTSVRHNVSEWFAKVSIKQDVQWIIVIDSTRAKEKKNRTSLMEKIRSDFSKHQGRLVEVSESVEHGSFSGLIEMVQAALLSHMSTLANAWDAILGTLRDEYTDDSWNAFEYCRAVTEYGRLYWSLGALEHALTIYDDLDRFLYQILNELAAADSANRPQWLACLKHGDVTVCPTLRKSMEQPSLDPKADISFLGLRHFLLSQQILLCLYMYQSRLRSRGAAPSLRVDFAGLIIKYTQHAQQTVLEQTTILEIHTSPLRLACWSILLIGESLHVCSLLAEPASVDAASGALCQLHTERFNAVLLLATVLTDPDSRSYLIDWLRKSPSLPDDCLLIELLQNETTFATQLQKVHDSSSAFLTQCERHRQSAVLGWKLGRWLGTKTGMLPYLLRFVSRLLEDGNKSQWVVDLVKEAVPSLHPTDDSIRLLSYHLFISLNDTDVSVRAKHADEFKTLLGSMPDARIKVLSLTPAPPPMVSIRVVDFVSHVQLPHEQLSIDVELISQLPISLSSYSLVLKMRELDESVMSRRKDPVFQLSYNARDAACRMLSPHRGHSFDRPAPSSPSSVIIQLQHTGDNDTTLHPGTNRLTVMSTSCERGCFVLEYAELLLIHNSLSIEFDVLDTRKPVMVFVQNTPNKLWIEDTKDLIAGVVQSISVGVEVGAATSDSELRITAADGTEMEFMSPCGSWSTSVSLTIPPLQVGQTHCLTVPLCVFMDAVMTESPAVRKVKLSFEWLDRTWLLDLSFIALLILSSRTSLLENKVLYELEVSRTLADEWTVVLETAELSVPATLSSTSSASPSDEKPPDTLARLLNTDLGDLVPNIMSTLVWILPVEGDTPINHRLAIGYRVKPSRDPLPGESCGFIDRSYSYKADVELRVPKVAYELCTQMLSQQPGAQLCRAGAPCDLVVSLRSLNQGVEMLYIVLDADAKVWTLNERAKVLHVKESGLGQMAFNVVPCTAGFLPYPSVSVYSCITVAPRHLDGAWTEGVDVLPGSPLVSFQRTAGRQIRVLAASQLEPRQDERKSQGFKQKLVKLFD